MVHADPVRPHDLEVLGLIPDKWHQVFSRVLAKEPAERYTTAAEFVRDLELCLGSWFGSLEGETVIMSSPTGAVASATPSSAEAGGQHSSGDGDDETVVMDQSALAESASGDDAETVIISPGSDETVQLEALGGPEPAPRTPPPTETSTGPDDETIIEPPPSLAGEETLYDGPVDETVIGDRTVTDPEEAAEATFIPDSTEAAAKGPSIVTEKRPTLWKLPDRKVLYALGGGAILLLILIVALVVGGYEPEPLPVDESPENTATEPIVVETGALSVASEPSGARVFLNGIAAGITPLEFPELDLGNYDVKLEHRGFVSEELTAELTAEAPRASLEVTLSAVVAPAPAYLRVRSVPEGAQVQVDGRTVGNTPIQRFRVQAGNRTLRLTHEGYVPWEDTVRVRAGSTATVDAEMSLMEAAEVPVEPEPDPEPDPADQVVEGSLVKRGEPGVVDPKCVECPTVSYPEAARRSGLQGLVELSFLIDETGAVRNIEVVQSAGEIFDKAVVETVERWKYEPATKHGVRVKIQWVQRFRFQRGL